MKNICEENKMAEPLRDGQADEERRNFLRKSLYVAYATPVVMSLLAEKANAASSWGNRTGTTTRPVPPPP